VTRGPFSYRLATCPDRGPLPHGHGSVSTPKQQRAGILTLPISKDFRDTLYSGSFQVSFSNGAAPAGEHLNATPVVLFHSVPRMRLSDRVLKSPPVGFWKMRRSNSGAIASMWSKMSACMRS